MRRLLEYTRNGFETLKGIAKREICYYRVKPRNACLFLTYRCTSQCKTCNIWRMWKREDLKKELGLKDWKKILDRIFQMGVESIEFFGGDVFIRKEILIPLIRYSTDHGIDTYMPTNCNLLDKKTAYGLVDAGLGTLYISLDGVGSVHDRVRGVDGTFDRVVSAVDHIRRARGRRTHPKIIINPTISRLNVESFERILPYAEEMGADSVHINYAAEFREESIVRSEIEGVIPTPFYSSLDSPILLDRDQAVLFKKKMKVLHKIPKEIDVSSGFVDMLTVNNLVGGTFPNRKCYVCHSQVTIDPYGNVVPCPFYWNFPLGNAGEEDFGSIWKNTRHRKFLRYQRRKRFDVCNHCNMGFYRLSPLQTILKIYLTIAAKGRE